jgi:hypothetical protein
VSSTTLSPPRAARAPAPRAAPTHPISTRWLVVTLLVASAAMLAVLSAHPMWFDEMQAWNIARSSGSLGELVANLRYEGHPVGWYLPLYAISRATGDPRAMQALELVIVVATFALVLFRSPFPYLYRVGLVGSYFLFFEYGAISRSYSLAALLLVAILCSLERRRPRWVVVTALSCALAFTVLSGAVVALALAAGIVLQRPWERGRRVYAGVTVVAAGVSALTCVPPSDFREFAQGLGSSSQFGSGVCVRFLSALGGFWRAAVPLPDARRAWNSNLFDGVTSAALVQAIAGIVVFAVVLRALRGSALAQRIWCIGAGGFVLFSVLVILPERYRYAGTAFLLLLTCAWLAWRSVVPRRPLALVFGAVLVVQVLATATVLPAGIGPRFSPDRHFADVIEREAPGASIVSGADFDALTASGFLDRPVFSVARNEWTRYFVHDAQQARGTARLRQSHVLCAASALAERRHRSVVAFGSLDREPTGVRRLARANGISVLRIEPGDRAAVCPR